METRVEVGTGEKRVGRIEFGKRFFEGLIVSGVREPLGGW